MMNGSPSRLNRSILLALVALLGLTVALAGSAVASSKGDVAVAAKKKCKKGKKSAVAAKKKKCKKKTTTPAPAPTPKVRATLTWSGNSDLDLLAWDTNGTKGSVEAPGAIANTSFSADDTNGGTETFTDTIGSTRQFAYGICADNVSSSTTWTVTIVSAGGNTQTLTNTFTTTQDNVRYTYSNPASFNPGPGIANGWCPTS
jgi:hypothetical protein